MRSFGAILSGLLQERGISATEAARQLGMRSKTSLLRILKDQSAYDTVRRFWEQLRAGDLLSLTADEQQQLESALDVLRVGPEAYSTYRALQSLLHMQTPPAGPLAVSGLPGIDDLDSLLRIYSAARDVKITIVGMCDASLFTSLQQMCSRMPADRQPAIDHYIFAFSDTSGIIRNVCSIFPLLFHRNYIPRMQPVDATAPQWNYPGDMLLCRFTSPDGQVHHHHMAFASPTQLQVIAYPDSAAYDFWQQLICANCAGLPPLKAAFCREQSPGDYLAYMEEIRLLERDRNIYILKPDIPLNLVPPEILCRSVLDSSESASFLPPQQMQPMLEQMLHSHSLRHAHLFERRKVTHMIFSQSAMLRFASTGRQSDHFFVARPYTGEERAAILTHCLEQSISNPYFNIHFSRSDALISDAEIDHYEGKGTVLLNAHTSYRLADDHSEALITHDGFNRQFRRYFTSELLHDHVLPTAETHAFLRSLIRIASRG